MLDRLSADLKTAMKAGQKRRVDTIRLMVAALKDREIEARGSDKAIGEPEALAVLQKMVKSRRESSDIFTKAGRDELARTENEEIEVIEGYLPKPMSEADAQAAIDEAIKEVGATTVKDMGKVVGLLKSRHAGRMDFAKASATVKGRLAA